MNYIILSLVVAIITILGPKFILDKSRCDDEEERCVMICNRPHNDFFWYSSQKDRAKCYERTKDEQCLES